MCKEFKNKMYTITLVWKTTGNIYIMKNFKIIKEIKAIELFIHFKDALVLI